MNEAHVSLSWAGDDDRTYDRNLARYWVLRTLVGRDPRTRDELLDRMDGLRNRAPLTQARNPAYFQVCWEREIRNMKRLAEAGVLARTVCEPGLSLA
jgi:hypothetical protein